MTETKEQELKPCPFCGSRNIRIVTHMSTRCYAACNECYAQTHMRLEKLSAIDVWNRRVAPQWSQEKPTETGDYWLAWRSSPQVPWRCEPVKISDFKDGMGLRIIGIGFNIQLLQTKLEMDRIINKGIVHYWAKLDYPPMPTKENQ